MTRLLLTSGRGPAECRIALQGLIAVLLREADAMAIDCDVVAGPAPDAHGPGSAIVVMHGAATSELAQRWEGSIQWICPSPVRPQHKRKNWFVGVSRLPERDDIGRQVKLQMSDVRFEAFAAGGPGGQHQNKTESAVRAVHVPTSLAVVAREERSQHRNKARALERLAELIASGRELAEAADRQSRQTAHDQLERGKPVRRFKGPKFREA